MIESSGLIQLATSYLTLGLALGTLIGVFVGWVISRSTR